MPRSEILTLTRALIALGLGGALAACEPADLMAGGGGGVGGKLAFVRDGALVLSDDAAAGEQVLTDSETSAQPAFSSNGQELVFGFHEAGGTDDAIDRIALTGLSQSTLAAPPAGTSYGSPDYSADDASVVFEAVTGADSVLMQVALDGGTPETLAGSEGLRQPVTLDAARVLALRDGQLVTFEVSTGVVTELGIATSARAAVSADGSRIAYVKDGTPDRIAVRSAADTDGTTEVLVAMALGDATRPAFSPEGDLVAFDTGGASPQLYAGNADGTGLPTLLQSGGQVAWAP